MSTAVIPQPLTALVSFLDNLRERAPLEQLRELLDEIDISLDELIPYLHFGDLCYCRNLICEGPWYELLCICWQSGQRSPIHNHAGSTCGLRVISGVATETLFDISPSGLIKPTRSTDNQAGYVCTSQDEEIHQVSNLQAAGCGLVTLHIYSPPLRAMDTFSLTEAGTQLYVPDNIPVCHLGDCI